MILHQLNRQFINLNQQISAIKYISILAFKILNFSNKTVDFIIEITKL